MTRLLTILLFAVSFYYLGYTSAAEQNWYTVFVILVGIIVGSAAAEVLSSNTTWRWSDFFGTHTGTIPPVAANYGIPQQLRTKRIDLDEAVFDDDLIYYEVLLFEDGNLVLELHRQEGIDPYLIIKNKLTELEYSWDNTDYLVDIATGDVTEDDMLTTRQFKQVYFFLNRCKDRGWI
jgi:hypothetical protein